MKQKERKRRYFIKILIILIFVFGIIYVFKEISKENQILINNENYEDLSRENVKIDNTNISKKYQKEKIINEYKGYEVCAKLEIPRISLESYILSNYSIESLNVSVVKFYGSNPNEYGNFCVAGHNFINKNMFSKLKDLKIKDKIIISDNKVGIVEYEIFAIYKVDKEDTSCLISSYKNTREVTLITCTNDSKKRIIVKAKEVI